MDNKRNYELDEIGGAPLLDFGFEHEEPEQADELTPDEAQSEFGGTAA